MQFLKQIKTKIKKKLEKYPAYIKLLKAKHKVAEFTLIAVMAFFNAVSPVWNFFCVKTLNPDQLKGTTNEIRQYAIELRN